jgi:hypothetical protein
MYLRLVVYVPLGPPDPLRGDEAFRRVREAASEALLALTADTPAP